MSEFCAKVRINSFLRHANRFCFRPRFGKIKAKKSIIAMLINNSKDSAKSTVSIEFSKDKLKNCGIDFMPIVNSIETTPAKNIPNPILEIVFEVDR